MSSQEPAAPGWYHAQGDPPGTQRYWDGELWQGGPQPVGGPPSPPPSYGAPPSPPPNYGGGGYVGGTAHYENSKATTALVLSIVSLVCCGLLAPVGWYVANQEIDAINRGRRDPSNLGTAKAARIIGIIGTVMLVLGFFTIAL